MKKTALILSGGGSRGAYEIGVWKALKALRIQVDMVMGTSVGAINGAMVAQNDLELAEKLWLQLDTSMIFDIGENESPTEEALVYAREIILHGGAGSSGLSDILHKYINEENLRKSGINYGLVTTEFPSFNECRLYKNDIPEGRIIDYIMASASCFPAVKKYIIEGKSFIDGGYCDNLPVAMALEQKADRIIAVDLQAVGVVKEDTLNLAKSSCEEFHLIKSPLPLGNFLVFDKINTTKLIRLGYLDTMRHFGKYDGVRYTFKKNIFKRSIFTEHQLKGAESAAAFLDLDPCTVYSRKSFAEALQKQLSDFQRTPTLSGALAQLREVKWSDPKKAIDIIKNMVSDSDLHLSLVIYIAESLRESEEESIFLNSHAFKLFREEVQAANFLMQQGLL